MVQKTDKFTDQRLFSSRNATTSSEKHSPFSISKMALGDPPNDLDSLAESPANSVQPDETQKDSDSSMLVGNKRPQPECSTAPGAIGSTCHLVYVRRKLETEHGKANIASIDDMACSPGFRKFSNEAQEKAEVEQEQLENSEEEHTKADVEAPSGETQLEILNYWTERFNRLQEHLQYLDRSGSKDYAERFRNFSVEELNRYAVELEKRALRLSLEEVLQERLIKELNLLGKSS